MPLRGLILFQRLRVRQVILLIVGLLVFAQGTSAIIDHIRPLELPGYTGWARNGLDTRVGECMLFNISSKMNGEKPTPNGLISVVKHNICTHGTNWSISIKCPYTTPHVTQRAVPAFYSRAYGPAILVGSQRLVNNPNADGFSVTEISFRLADVGFYTVEVVLESLFQPNLKVMPHEGDNLDYEGFLLPEFPLFLIVQSDNNHSKASSTRLWNSSDWPCTSKTTEVIKMCSTSDIQSDMSIATGRWIVLGHAYRLSEFYNRTSQDERFRVNGANRIAIMTEYRLFDCTLLSFDAINSRSSYTECINKFDDNESRLHFIFIGDSVTQIHLDHFTWLGGHWPVKPILSIVDLRGEYSTTYCLLTFVVLIINVFCFHIKLMIKMEYPCVSMKLGQNWMKYVKYIQNLAKLSFLMLVYIKYKNFVHPGQLGGEKSTMCLIQ